MTNHFDITIAGSTPLAGLLAGILARDHGAKTCWIGQFPNQLQLQRGFDLSVGAITRPETWRLLGDNVAETIRHLSTIGDGKVLERVDPLFVAQTRAGADALAHMRVTAHAHSAAVERQPVSADYNTAYQFRDAVRVLRRPLCAAIPAWLETMGVAQYSPQDVRVHSSRKKAAQISLSDQKITSDTVVLAGDHAIMNHLPETDVSKHFSSHAVSAVLTEPVAPMSTSVMLEVDTGTVVYQRTGGSLDCVGHGDAATIVGSALSYVRHGQTTRLAGVADFTQLTSRDGAAVFGKLSGSGVTILGGLGLTGLFQAPAIARRLAGASTEFEEAYFDARAPMSKKPRQNVAEFISANAETHS